MNTNIDANGQMNWHTKLRVSASFCIALGVSRIVACYLAIVFTQRLIHRTILLQGETLSVTATVYAALIIALISVWQIFAGVYGVRRWGEPNRAFSVAVTAGILALVEGAVIIGVFVLFIQQTLFSMETIFFDLPLLPLVLVFVGSIAVFTYARTAFSYVLQTRKTALEAV